MKPNILLTLLALLLPGCATLKPYAIKTAPIVEAGISAAGGNYGTLASQLYGMAIQAWAGKPVAQGTAIPAISKAVVPLLPANKTGNTVASILDGSGTAGSG